MGMAIGQKISFSDEANRIVMGNNSYLSLSATNSLGETDYMGVKTKEGTFTLLVAQDYGASMEIGDPQVPVMKKIIEVPLDADFEINIIHETSSEFSLKDFGITDKLMPTQAPVSKSIDNPEDIEFNYNTSAYNTDDYLYQERIRIVPVGMMRGVRLARLKFIRFNIILYKIKSGYLTTSSSR